MPATVYADILTRAHKGGTAANVNLHVEYALNELMTGIRHKSFFDSAGFFSEISTEGQTNTASARLLGGSGAVMYRKSGETLAGTRIPNEKQVYTVDTASYQRVAVDFIDQWIAPDWTSEYVEEMKHAHALEYDQCHMNRLIKAAAYTPPASVANRFTDGTTRVYNMNEYRNPAGAGIIVSQEDRDHNANVVMAYLARIFERERNFAHLVGAGGADVHDLVTLIDPSVFEMLVQSQKLMNIQYAGGGVGNNFPLRRVAYVNGQRVIECSLFPKAPVAAHGRGTTWNLSADEVRTRILVFDPRQTLKRIRAQGMNLVYWTKQEEHTDFIDTYQMFTVEVHNGSRAYALRIPA